MIIQEKCIQFKKIKIEFKPKIYKYNHIIDKL